MPDFINFENGFTYSQVQWAIVAHVLSAGAAFMIAGFVYFIGTAQGLSRRYRVTSYISAAVMLSAFLELFLGWLEWRRTFAFNGTVFERIPTELFTNGYRYMNWSIDVPMLTLQLFIVLGLTGDRLMSVWGKVAAAGLLMIWTGYAGQFYEETDRTLFWIWGGISTLFYIYLLIPVLRHTARAIPLVPAKAAQYFRIFLWFFPVTWSLYIVAYLMPVIWDDSSGAVIRQIVFTTADILTKVIFGIFLGLAARHLSAAEEGHDDAQESGQLSDSSMSRI